MTLLLAGRPALASLTPYQLAHHPCTPSLALASPVPAPAADFGEEQAAQLKELAKAGDLPHMLFYGPSGAGKKTRIMCLLREIFGAGVERVKLEHRPFKTPSGKVRRAGARALRVHVTLWSAPGCKDPHSHPRHRPLPRWWR